MSSLFDKIPPEYRKAFFEGLPTGDVEYVRKLAEEFKENLDFNLESFFSFALLPCYDCMWTGMHIIAGHIIYRLSDFVPKEKREIIMIYPSPTGSIINDDGESWDSLEDWRKQWEKKYPFIPELTKMLPPNMLAMLPEGKSQQ